VDRARTDEASRRFYTAIFIATTFANRLFVCPAGLAGYERHQGETKSVDLEAVGLMNRLACNLVLM
jgi:hypothetical protein